MLNVESMTKRIMSNINKRVETSLTETAQFIIDDVIIKETTPFKSGDTQNSYRIEKINNKNVLIVVGGKEVGIPYVNRIYYHPEFNFNHKFNKNAKGLWLQDYTEGKDYSRVLEEFKKNLFR